MPDQQFLLSPARHFIQERYGVSRVRRSARNAGMEAGDHEIHLLGKIGPEAAEIFLGILQQENGSGHFHGDRFGLP